jgi:hypothetical protein
MFTTNNFYNLSTPMPAGDAHTQKLQAALNSYRQAQLAGWLGKLWAALRGRCTGLVNLEKVQAEGKVASRRYVGVRSVALKQICGSEGRSQDFDGRFNPLRGHTQQRWLNVMLARQAGIPLPPVELIQIGAAYFVRDGHHRISVARALDEDCIDAEVTLWELADASAPAARLATRAPAAAKSPAAI